MQTIKFALLAALITISLSQTAQKAANIDYLSMGYNIYLGDPLANAVDPGFQISPIFNLTYLQNNTSPDGKYLEPDMITIASDVSCVLNSAATVISGANSYLHSLDVIVSVDGGSPFGGLTASTNYKTVEQSTSNQSTFYTLATGQCSVYTAEMTLMDLPEIDDLFIQNAITYLESSDSDSHYQFLQGYGTHYVQQITMGSRLSVMNSLTKSAMENLQLQGVSVTVAAQASFMGFYAGYNTSVSTQSTYISSYQSASSSFEVSTIGSVPPSGGNSIAWAQQAVTNPMPIKYSLTPLNQLFASPTVKAAMKAASSSATFQTIQANLKAALGGGYCNYLLGQGTVASCSAPPPDQPLPVSNGSCVMCASGCGGIYSQSQGIFDDTLDQPYWMIDYPIDCASTTILGENQYTNGVDLCCVPEVTGEVQGSCRMCTTCGGQFSYQTGSIWDDFDPTDSWDNGWLQAYGDSCEGNLQPQGGLPAPNGYAFCCDQPDMCAMCSTCGGEYPYEAGALAVGDAYHRNFGFYGTSCSGSLGFGENAGVDGMKLCCAQQQ